MKMNILVAIDDSEFSRVVLESIMERPWQQGCIFKIISVVEPFHPEYAGWHTSYIPLAIEAQKEVVDAAQKLVDSAVASLKPRFGDTNVIGEVIEGYVTDKILETAKSWPAEMILVGSHGRTGFTKLFLGSVSEGVVSHAPCSVEVVKNPHHAHGHSSREKAAS